MTLLDFGLFVLALSALFLAIGAHLEISRLRRSVKALLDLEHARIFADEKDGEP